MSPQNLGLSTLTVLTSVARGFSYGFDVIDATGLQSGTVYRALSRLEELGLVRSRWEAPEKSVRERRPRRKYYTITKRGETELASARKRMLGLGFFAPAVGGQPDLHRKES